MPLYNRLDGMHVEGDPLFRQFGPRIGQYVGPFVASKSTVAWDPLGGLASADFIHGVP